MNWEKIGEDWGELERIGEDWGELERIIRVDLGVNIRVD